MQRLLFVLVFLLLAAPIFAADGYQNTLASWNEVVRNAGQYSLPLQNLYAEVEAQVGPDKSRLNQAFGNRLAQQYPGSRFYGTSVLFGTLALNSYTQLTFDAAWNIVVLRQEMGGLIKSYDFRGQTLEVTNGPNRVKFKLYQKQPQRSEFTVVDIPAISATAHHLWAKKGVRQGVYQPSKEILNEVYAQRIALIEGTRMDQLAVAMVESDATRQQILEIADELYSKRTDASAPAVNRRVSAPPVAQNGPVAQPITPDLPKSNFFKALPWYFWPALLFVGTFKVLAGKSRRDGQKRRSRTWRRPEYDSKGPTPKSTSRPSPGEGAEDFSLGDPAAPEDFVLSQSPEQPQPMKPTEWSLEVLQSLEWKRFETVCAEYLRMAGHDPRETKIGPDGGIDIWVYQPGSEKAVGIVQCKAWKSYKVGVKPVRELYGVMAAEGVGHGKFITTGEFTAEARSFAEGKRLELISGEKFLAAIGKLSAEKRRELLDSATQGDYRTPTCPQCGTKMTLKQGQGQWRDFWGCPKYPRCKATLVYKSELA